MTQENPNFEILNRLDPQSVNLQKLEMEIRDTSGNKKYTVKDIVLVKYLHGNYTLDYTLNNKFVRASFDYYDTKVTNEYYVPINNDRGQEITSQILTTLDLNQRSRALSAENQ